MLAKVMLPVLGAAVLAAVYAINEGAVRVAVGEQKPGELTSISCCPRRSSRRA